MRGNVHLHEAMRMLEYEEDAAEESRIDIQGQIEKLRRRRSSDRAQDIHDLLQRMSAVRATLQQLSRRLHTIGLLLNIIISIKQ